MKRLSYDLYRRDMEDDFDEYSVLLALRDMMGNSREFYRSIRFLHPDTRNHIVAAHERNNATVMTILRAYMTINASTRYTINIPLPHTTVAGLDFEDPVPIVPNADQIAAATEVNIRSPDGTTCSICHDDMSNGTRIRHCSHYFHTACINQWFTMNPRCPMCRHDIREEVPVTPPARRPTNDIESLLRAAMGDTYNDSGVHPD